MSILRSIYSTFSLACGGPGGSVGRGPEPRPTYLYRRPGSGRMTWRLMVSFGGWRVARHGGQPALAVAHGDHTPTLRSGLELSQGDHTPTLRYKADCSSEPSGVRMLCVGRRWIDRARRRSRRRRASGILAGTLAEHSVRSEQVSDAHIQREASLQSCRILQFFRRAAHERARAHQRDSLAF